MTLVAGDAIEFLRTLDDDSVNLVATDPPYFKVKDEPWDNQWDNDDAFLAWLDTVLVEIGRVLAPNGSLYLFASPQMSARVEVLIGVRNNVLGNIRWVKEHGWHKKVRPSDLRRYLSPWESVVFAEPFECSDSWVQASDGVRASVFEPLRKYLYDECIRAGWTTSALNEAMGFAPHGMAERHYFGRSQWQLPTAEHYESMQRILNNGTHEVLRREYEVLRREYEDLRRPFNATVETPYTDVWTFPTVQSYTGKHVCEKPLTMMEHIVALSSRPGDLRVDPFMGSGTTGVAAERLGRRFAGSDLSEHWVEVARHRIVSEGRTLFS